MLARCTHCESTFVTSQFGRQRCPKCGVEVVVEDPRATPGEAPPPVAQPADQLELSPWERRGELGLLPALGQTISAVLGKPGPFFTHLRYDTDDGALLYFAFVALIPTLIFEIFSWRFTNPDEMKQAFDQLSQLGVGNLSTLEPLIKQSTQYAKFEATFPGLITNLISSSASLVLGLFFCAAVVHGALTVLGQAKGGWTATFKATVYAATPFLFTIMPVCGGLIAATWATGIQIYAIARAHRITMTMATVGVLTLHATAITCCCGALFLGVAAAGLGH